ncbi:MAG: hypothetical protein JNL58_04130 [Planctomyces sp.]|nr:hypothetical protein [Planctomyces sp.]
MTPNNYDGKRRCLDDEQRIHAKQLLERGWAILDVARDCGLSETELRIEVGLPQWQSEPVQERQRNKSDMGGK